MATESSLAGTRILIVEDNAYIGFDIRVELTDRGAEVLGPVSDVDTALSVVASEPGFDAAVLDVNLHGELVFPLADHLVRHDIPVVFATCYGAEVIPYRLRHIPRLVKPVRSSDVASAVAELVSRVTSA